MKIGLSFEEKVNIVKRAYSKTLDYRVFIKDGNIYVCDNDKISYHKDGSKIYRSCTLVRDSDLAYDSETGNYYLNDCDEPHFRIKVEGLEIIWVRKIPRTKKSKDEIALNLICEISYRSVRLVFKSKVDRTKLKSVIDDLMDQYEELETPDVSRYDYIVDRIKDNQLLTRIEFFQPKLL